MDNILPAPVDKVPDELTDNTIFGSTVAEWSMENQHSFDAIIINSFVPFLQAYILQKLQNTSD
jgi:hypothetical protein